MDDLLCLDRCRPSPLHSPVPSELCEIITPLKVPAWEASLANHPDKAFYKYIMAGIKHGFRIGFDRARSLTPAKRNMLSASDHPEVVTDYLAKEMQKGRTCPSPLVPWQCSKFGVIPKKHQPGEWRLILDLSAPQGGSINDGISKQHSSLQYVSVLDMAKQVYHFGKGALMAKSDIKSAFRIVPVHPEDRLLLGVQWDNRFYVDTVLPFGLRSAPKIFNALADALVWIAKQKGAHFLEHYLDDFITIGEPLSTECLSNLEVLLDTCRSLGIPIAEDKTVLPTTLITFLGIEIDSVAQELRLPDDKLTRISSSLQTWSSRKSATKKELQSLAGTLEDAARIIRPGKTFLRRLYEAIASLAKPHHHIRLNAALRSDVGWWQAFIREWNGISLLSAICPSTPTTSITSDTSGSWGCGAFWDCFWFQLAWDNFPDYVNENIATKELLPIVIAAAIWGKHWYGEIVLCRCDNEAVVQVLSKRSCKSQSLMHLLRCLFFFEAHFSFHMIAIHIKGTTNELADDLSRNKLSSFLQKTGNRAPATPIPAELLDMLMGSRPDWTSEHWRQMFTDILRKVWQPPP